MKGQLMPKVTVWLAAMAALLLPQGLAAQPAAAPDRALAVGTVISSADDIVIGGWRKLYRGTYAKRIQQPQSIAEAQECCFATFEKGNALVVVRTVPVTRNRADEPLTERIVDSKWITRKPSESVTDCQILYISPQLSLYDNKTEAIRSVAMDNEVFFIIQWRDPGSYCTFGD